MLRQKARIKCDVEGNEHSKFFHSFVKRRDNKNNIRGLMVNEIWSEDPKAIKMEMARYYKALFIEGMTIKPLFCCDRIGKFSDDEAVMLEKGFLEKEVWEAICGCGGDKSPGPDGFNFKFIKKFWDVLKSDLMLAVKCLEIGVRQGDPLSPFHFILVAKGLNAIVNDAVKTVFLGGVRIGNNSVVVSHLQYADDTILFEEWSKENSNSLMCILKCFEEVFGLRVNYIKNKLYGVGVNDREIGDMARWMR
ncbi:putative ribonuclease H protein [Tanacetum coccineum]|uniref:Ribonuclease H protein n=1 Tax=Tanacetum coccineum TaxID=301880 RepID=A0ABQ5HV95_9ASTR